MLKREPSGNVVIETASLAMRFLHRSGGAPMEIYSGGMMVSNPFPGAGTSAAFDTGQDPTQASANGHTENPIAIFDHPETNRFAYYGREQIFSNLDGYQISGFFPDFWLSAEKPDDAIASGVLGNDTGWRTLYQPRHIKSQLETPDCPVVFQGSRSIRYGFFFPADVWKYLPSKPWNHRLRSFGRRRIAFKMTLSLHDAAKYDKTAAGGAIFGASIPETGRWFREDVIKASKKNTLIFMADGKYILRENDRVLRSGNLGRPLRRKLVSPEGLEVEIRTHNYTPGLVEVWVDGKVLTSATTTMFGPHAALYASTVGGLIRFGNRQFFHVGVEGVVKYKERWEGDGGIDSEIRISTLHELEPPMFYKANLPGIFMNPETFPLGNRTTMGRRADGTWEPATGIHKFSDYSAYWAGNEAGNCGLRCENLVATINGAPSPDAHLLIEASPVDRTNFVLMLNPFPLGFAGQVRECFVGATWYGTRG